MYIYIYIYTAAHMVVLFSYTSDMSLDLDRSFSHAMAIWCTRPRYRMVGFLHDSAILISARLSSCTINLAFSGSTEFHREKPW